MVTFAVSDVPRDDTRLATVGADAQVAALGWKTFEARRIGAKDVVQAPLVHPLALAVHLAFETHRPLVLTPDAVWLCLAQGLATHVDLHAEELRPRLVRHAGKLDLEARRDDFVPGDPDNDWPAAIHTLTAKIREHLGGRADLFVADFTTTGPLERTASRVALMGAMRQYFSYTVATLCGIPEITLAGTPEDWASIRQRAAVFDELELSWWTERLEPVLAKLEETSRGTIDRAFWGRLYKVEHASGGDRSCGWLNALFPYVGDPAKPNTFPDVDAGPFAGHKLSDYPAGRTRVPFTWRLLEERLPMELVAGLWGVTQDESGALGVTAGWLVSRAREESGFLRSPGGEGWPARLHPRPGNVVETFESLRHEAGDEATALSIWDAPKLRSIDGVQSLRGLVELAISNAPSLESLAPLTGMSTLVNLSLMGCTALRGVGPVLETLPALTHLSLMGCKQLPLEDFLPIARMERLQYLVLWHCEALPEALRCVHKTPEEIAVARAALAALAR
jgi:hypothetical protein